MPDALDALPPQLRACAEQALRHPAEVHTDACGWLGSDAEHPCTCGVPAILRWLIDTFGLDAADDVANKHHSA